MLKKVCSLTLALMMLVGLTACGGTPEVDIQAVKTDMQTQLAITNATDLPVDTLLSLYGITAESVADSASFMILSDIFPAECIMIKAVDTAAASEISTKLQTRLDSLKAQSVNYDPESYAIAQACSVLVNDVYVAMFFSEYGTEMETIYNSYF